MFALFLGSIETIMAVFRTTESSDQFYYEILNVIRFLEDPEAELLHTGFNSSSDPTSGLR